MKYLVLLVLPALLVGQSSSSGQSRPVRQNVPPASESEPVKPEERCTVEGTVFNSTTGEPLKKANLMLRRADPSPGGMGMSYAAVSNAAGHFIVRDIEPGRYRLGVERAGFVNQQYGAKTSSSAGTVLTLEKSQKMSDLTFKLIPQGVITGRVVDEDGDPVQSVSLMVMRRMYVRGRRQWTPANGSSTNDLGEYRIHSLAPGHYLLAATYRPGRFMEPTQGGAGESYAPTYYPSASSPDAAAPIDVTAGSQLRGIDIRLQKTKTVQIRGRVLNAAGNGVRRTMLSLQPKGETALGFMDRNMSQPFNDKGDFIMNNVTPGSYILMATTNEDGKMLSARMPLEVGASSIEDITLQPAPGFDIAGRVRIDGAEPENRITNMRVILQPKGAAMFNGPGAQGGQIKDDKTFALTGVQPELYDVRVFGAPDGGYVQSIRAGDAEVMDAGLDLTNGAPPGEITVVIAMAAGQITGAVQNEKSEPAPGANVVLIPEGSRRENDRWYQMTSTDQYGNYTLKNVAPGDYRVFAFDKVEYGSYQDPEWLKPFESQGEKVSIKENARESVQLKLLLNEAQQ